MKLLDFISERSVTNTRQFFFTSIIVFIGAVIIGGLTTQQPFLAIGGVVAAFLFLTMLKWPDIATLLVIFFIYTNAGPVLIRFHGMPSYIVMAFPLILVIPLVWYLFFLRQKLIITPVFILLLALLVIYTLGALYSKDFKLALPELIEFSIEGVLLYFLFTNVIRTSLMLKRVIWVLLIAGALIGGLSFFQQVTNTFDNNYGGFAQVSESAFGTGVENLQGEIEQPRLSGSIGEKNRYAQIMLMLVPLGVFQFWIYRSTGKRILTLVATGFIVIGGALAFSRGAAVGFALMIMIMVFFRYIKFSQLIFLLIGVLLILFMFPQYGVRLASLNVFTELVSKEGGAPLSGADSSIKDRATEILSALLIFRDHPFIGVGPGMSQYYTEEYSKEIGISNISSNLKAHSLFPGIAADAGMLGLTCFLLILFIPLRNLAIARKEWMVKHPNWSYLATGFFQALICYIASGLFLHLSYMRFLYLILALAVVASKLGDSDAAKFLELTRDSEGDLSLA